MKKRDSDRTAIPAAPGYDVALPFYGEDDKDRLGPVVGLSYDPVIAWIVEIRPRYDAELCEEWLNSHAVPVSVHGQLEKNAFAIRAPGGRILFRGNREFETEAEAIADLNQARVSKRRAELKAA